MFPEKTVFQKEVSNITTVGIQTWNLARFSRVEKELRNKVHIQKFVIRFVVNLEIFCVV
jgi:hypothetical protein